MTRQVLAITRVAVGRYIADRRALLFMFILPVAVILIVGATVTGGAKVRVGIVNLGSGQADADLATALRHSPLLRVQEYGSVHTAQTALARGEAVAVAILPAGMDAALRSGASVNVAVMSVPTSTDAQAAVADIRSVVADVGGRVQAAVFATEQGAGTYEGNMAVATAGTISRIAVTDSIVQRAERILPRGFSYSAPTMLVMFVFLNATAAGAMIVDTRRLGMYERMAAAPVRAATIVAGESLTYVVIALLQSALIVGVGALVFGVSWGNPIAALVLVLTWALVGAGAGMLAGTLFRTPEQATAVAPALGIALAMLGGCMWPLAITSRAMRLAGHFTPQAWAVDAWTALLSRHGTLTSIATNLGVLSAFAAAFLTLATVRLRRSLA